jgi:integration host factor subunit beta
MTKSELINSLANQFPQLTHLDVTIAVQSMLDSMTVALVNNDRIEVRGFGSFSVNTRPPRIARNPKTGEKIQVEVKHVPHFKPGSDLRKRVKNSD